MIGAGDQDEVLPLVLHRLDPDLFQADWFVQSQAAGWTIRSYFLFVVEVFAIPAGIDAAVTVLYAAVWMVIAYNVYHLALELVENRIAAACSVVLALAVCLHWTLGGNDLIQRELVPEMMGWAFALPALRYFLKDRITGSALLLGVAAWFHPLVGMLTALVLGLVLLLDLLDWYHRRLARRQLARFSTSFLIFAGPAVIPIIVTELLMPAPDIPVTPTVFHLLAEFRLPHHHLFHSFSTGSVVRFAGLAALGLMSLFLLTRNARVQHAPFVLRMLGIIAFLCVAAYLFTEVVPVLAVAKLQFFKLTVWAKVLFIIMISGWLVTWLSGPLRRWIEDALDRSRRGWALTAGAWIVTGGLIAAGVNPPYGKLQPVSHRNSDLYAVEAWASRNTPEHALFAIPPSIDSFRYHARRSVLVNFKSFPFQEPLMYEWFQRLMDVAPVEPPERGTGILPELDRAYHANTRERWTSLADAYGIDYALVQLNRAAHIFDEPPVFESGPWAVYQLSP